MNINEAQQQVVTDSPYSMRRRLVDTANQLLDWVLRRVNAPGFVRPLDFADQVTGDRIRIRITGRFTVFTVNNREYWFRRGSGMFDGTGYRCDYPSEESLDCTLADILESTAPLGWWGRLKQRLPSIRSGHSG